ncbi:RNA polymerase sigma factor [Aquabacterium sp. OR-4]|uniref:RNA polymerase sigma factor n=1 Tax=Aquabacterium sp. OR-4 TaxID=2978127 RepID=UPI0021B27643|nr:sigma-70 family RNA polymerase sigma factor [Aquabacterium sp. OR-4]MDT7838192.1 sigma-70 family RNA polymerase sigma factor [Aquabacterium sp. OR-4]
MNSVGAVVPPHEQHLRDLLARIRGGDKQAMKQLYEQVAPGLLQFIRARTDDAAEAADVVQDAFMAVWRTADRYEGRSSVKTWIFAIARFNHIDRLRKRGREEPLDEDFEAPDIAPQPQALAEAASDAHQVRVCIDKLPRAQARAVRLAFYDELSYGEIAAVEDIPEGTVKTRIFHAKKILAQCLTRRLHADSQRPA